jgi:hypothetical protein
VPVEKIAVGRSEVNCPPTWPSPGMNIHRGLDARAGGRLLGGAPASVRPGWPCSPRRPAHARVRADRIDRDHGHKLVDPGLPVEPWQVRRSNGHAMRAVLVMRSLGRTAQDHLPDDPAEMRERLARHLDTHDVLVLTGGISAGQFTTCRRCSPVGAVPSWSRSVGSTDGSACEPDSRFGLPAAVSALVCRCASSCRNPRRERGGPLQAEKSARGGVPCGRR